MFYDCFHFRLSFSCFGQNLYQCLFVCLLKVKFMGFSSFSFNVEAVGKKAIIIKMKLKMNSILPPPFLMLIFSYYLRHHHYQQSFCQSNHAFSCPLQYFCIIHIVHDSNVSCLLSASAMAIGTSASASTTFAFISSTRALISCSERQPLHVALLL